MCKLKQRDLSLRKLPEKLDQIMAHYSSQEYRRSYPFLDYFVRISRGDKELCTRLDARLHEQIVSKSDAVDFAYPDIDDSFNPSSYRIFYKRKWSRYVTF